MKVLVFPCRGSPRFGSNLGLIIVDNQIAATISKPSRMIFIIWVDLEERGDMGKILVVIVGIIWCIDDKKQMLC